MPSQQEKHTKTLKRSSVWGPVGFEFVAAPTGSWRLERPVVDFDKCSKCGICKNYCPCDIVTVDKDAKECVTFDLYFCKGCGICANECPKGCIEMVDEREVT